MLKICIIAMSSDAPIKEKQVLLAPYILKRYVMHYSEEGTTDFKILDYPHNAKPSQIIQDIEVYQPDVLALSIYLWNYLELIETAKTLKSNNKDLMIFAGGPMVSFNPTDMLNEHPYLDAISFDDRRGETVFLDFVHSCIQKNDLQTVKGIYYRSRKDQKIYKTEPMDKDPDSSVELSPFVRGDIVLDDEKGYYVTMETSRGCPFLCGYCVWGKGNKMRFYPLERIFKEVEIVYNNPNVKHVLFADASMTNNRKRTIEIIEHMKKQKHFNQISTRMHLNIGSMNEDLTKALSSIPGFSFDFGLQTANHKALTIVDKNRPSPEQFRDKIEKMREWVPHFKFSVDLMIGLPRDTLEEFKNTVDFCLSLQPYRFFMAYPVCLLPGTKFYDERDILGFNYTNSFPQAVISTDLFPLDDIHEALKISTWVQLLTYYYPVLGEFFYSICTGRYDGTRYTVIRKWIDIIEAKVKLFENFDLTRFKDNLTTEWYLAKGNLLKQASTAEVAYTIYSTIYDLYSGDDTMRSNKDIAFSLDILSFYRDQKLNPVGWSGRDQLPQEFFRKHTEDKLKRVHSIFR